MYRRGIKAIGCCISIIILVCVGTVCAQTNGLQVSSTDYLMTFGTHIFAGPPPGYTGEPDHLNYCLTWRIVKADGTITSGRDIFTITGESFAPHFTQLSAGTLVGVTIFAQDAGSTPTLPRNWFYFGANYLQVFLTTSNTSPTGPTYNAGTMQLIGGNAAADYSLSWPTSPIVQPMDSRGFDVSLYPPNPGAGNALAYTLKWNADGAGALRYRIKSIQFVYIASSTAGNRVVQMSFSNASGMAEIQLAAPVVQPAGITGIYTFGAGMPASSVGNGTYLWQTQGLPAYLDLSAFDGPHVLNMNSIGMQPGDQITNVVIRAETWNDLD